MTDTEGILREYMTYLEWKKLYQVYIQTELFLSMVFHRYFCEFLCTVRLHYFLENAKIIKKIYCRL